VFTVGTSARSVSSVQSSANEGEFAKPLDTVQEIIEGFEVKVNIWSNGLLSFLLTR
jgi:hypothetical protein